MYGSAKNHMWNSIVVAWVSRYGEEHDNALARARKNKARNAPGKEAVARGRWSATLWGEVDGDDDVAVGIANLRGFEDVPAIGRTFPLPGVGRGRGST